MFNVLPSSQHHLPILVVITFLTAVLYNLLTVDARVLGPGLTSRNTLGLMSLGAGGATVLVREVADHMGRAIGPKWGPLGTLLVFEAAIVGGGIGLALVSFVSRMRTCRSELSAVGCHIACSKTEIKGAAWGQLLDASRSRIGLCVIDIPW